MSKIPLGYIYCIENKLNKKTYIGSRLLSRDKYWRHYMGSGKLIKQAIEKYGKNNFSKKFISYHFSLDALYSIEIEEIQKAKRRGKAEYNLSTTLSGGNTIASFDKERTKEMYAGIAETLREKYEKGEWISHPNLSKRNEIMKWEAENLSTVLSSYDTLNSMKKVSEENGFIYKRVRDLLKKEDVVLNHQNKAGKSTSSREQVEEKYIKTAVSIARSQTTRSGMTTLERHDNLLKKDLVELSGVYNRKDLEAYLQISHGSFNKFLLKHRIGKTYVVKENPEKCFLCEAYRIGYIKRS